MINNCDICKNKEKCSKFRINSKEWNNLTCYDFNEISSPQLVEHIIKNFCKDEHRSDLWTNIEIPLYKTLKAFELLLDKVLDKDGLNEYVDMLFEKCLINEEEYNLLKEVLK